MSFAGNQFFLWLSCSALIALPLCNARAETLGRSVSDALSSHPAVEAAKASEGAAVRDRKENFSGYLPEISLSATGGRNYADNSTSRGLSVTRGAGFSYLWEGTATVRQMLFDGFETSSRVDAARAREASAKTDIVGAQESIASNASLSYVELMRLTKAIDMIERHTKVVDDYLARIKTLVDEGVSDDVEYQQARDIRVLIDTLLADHYGQLRTAEAQYLEAVGRLPVGTLEAPMPIVELIPETPEEAIERALETHPSLKSALYGAEAASHEIDAARAEFYPDVNGELSYLKSDKRDIIGGEVVDAKALVRMNWNFYAGGETFHKVGKSRFEYEERLARGRELQRRIEQAIRTAYAEYETAQKRFENQKKRETLNDELFNAYESQFEGARITLLQLMQSENQRFTARLEKINGFYRLLSGQYAVLAAMGQLQGALNTQISDAGVFAHEQE